MPRQSLICVHIKVDPKGQRPKILQSRSNSISGFSWLELLYI